MIKNKDRKIDYINEIIKRKSIIVNWCRTTMVKKSQYIFAILGCNILQYSYKTNQWIITIF